MDPKTFLTTLWGETPPGPVLVWTLPGKDSHWYKKFDQVNKDLARRKAKDIYTGVGLPVTNPPMSRKIRGVAESVTAITGMWADIDVAHHSHKKQNHAPTTDKALEILEQFTFTPTLTINSGHGIQAWWLFNKPWVFQSVKEHNQAQALAQWWYHHLNDLCQQEGCVADPVWSIDQVLRVPGTINNKDPEEPVPVTVISSDGPRFDRQEFLDRVPDDFRPLVSVSKDRNGKVHDNGLILKGDANPPTEKLLNLLDIHPKFRASWREERSDLEGSPSSYDMSLAHIALSSQWTDQEATDLLIAWRRKHGHDLKLREDYYARTIAKAREPIQASKAEEQLSEALDNPEDANEDVIKDSLGTLMGFGIIHIIKYVGEPSIYRLVTDKGDANLGEITSITSQTNFRNKFADATGHLIPKQDPKLWDKTAQAMLNACEWVEVGDATHPSRQTKAWLTSYLLEKTIFDDPEEAARGKKPFTRKGHTYIFGDDFKKWLEHSTGNQLSDHSISQRLKMIGANSDKVTITVGGKKTSRSCWQLPNFDEEEAQ